MSPVTHLTTLVDPYGAHASKNASSIAISASLHSSVHFVVSDFADSTEDCDSPTSSTSSCASFIGNYSFDSLNPYRSLIDQCQTTSDMANAYEKHRRTRNAAKFAEMSQSHKVTPDTILSGLILDNQPAEFDPRNCITIWSRPPSHVMDLIGKIQMRLVSSISPKCSSATIDHVPQSWADKSNNGPLWLMPRECLHLSALEIIHSAPAESVVSQLSLLRPYIRDILNPVGNCPILMRPLVCFDSSALALTFVPVDQPSTKRSVTGVDSDEKDARYSYTHYRATLYDTVTKVAGVPVESRYQVPSAHVTIARFINELSPAAIDALLLEINQINEWLDATFGDPGAFAWRIGQERATECRCGRIWYGGGWSEGQGVALDELDNLEE